MDKKLISGKRRARKLAVQALYQWFMSDSPLHDIEAQFCAVNNMEKVDVEYFRCLLRGVVEVVDRLSI